MKLSRVICLILIGILSTGNTAYTRAKDTKKDNWNDFEKRILDIEKGPYSKIDLDTARAYLASGRQYEISDPSYAKRAYKLTKSILEAAERGEDLMSTEQGFFWRGYVSRFAPDAQFYSIYVPKSYDPKNAEKKWPLILSLHGGSSNHNIWMAMLLGNVIPVSDYRKNFRTQYRAAVHEDEAIIAAPQGLGQNHWRGSAQQDVADVMDDVKRHYNIDENKIFLNGLSNGAVASFKIGLDRAWRFAAVLPMSGIVDWKSHAAGKDAHPAEQIVMKNESAITIAKNASNTNFVFFHGFKDSGFDVSQARKLDAELNDLDIPHEYREISNLGHDLTQVLWKDMKILSYVRKYTRKEYRRQVAMVTTSERANRQFWLVLDDRFDHKSEARISARIATKRKIKVETSNVERFTLLLSEAPATSGSLRIIVDGEEADLGPFTMGSRVTLNRIESLDGSISWRYWNGVTASPGTRKKTRLSGPLGDVLWESQVHVYGTQVSSDTDVLRRAAELGARGWIKDKDFTQVRHLVIPDTSLTPDLIQSRALVLYGNAKNNSVLAEIGNRLPIKVGPDFIEMRGERLTDPSVGAKFICPNPLRPERYLVVQAGLSAGAVEKAGVLPMFLPDYVIFDRRFTTDLPKMALGEQTVVEMGFFSETWQLTPKLDGSAISSK